MISCKDCQYKYKDIFWFCLLEKTENSDASIDDHGEPFDFVPEWCKLKEAMQMKDVYIHYGSTHFRPEAFVTPVNDDWTKPKGGLWACLKDNEHAYTWKKWNESEEFRECNDDYAFCFTLKDDANIHYIYCPLDLYTLPLLSNRESEVKIDFEKCLSIGIDAIELRYFGDWEKASPSGELYWKLWGWDCDSIIILNPDCIEKEW